MNRAIWRIIISYTIVFSVIYLCERVSFWIYPIAVIVLGNQYFTIILLGHEGTHGLLHRNQKINRTLARYFCHFPFFISHTHYSMTHLLHHRNLGTDKDPDLYIYQSSYSSIEEWLRISAQNLLNLSIVFQFSNYFNGSLNFIKGKYPFKIKTDFLEFFSFWFFSLAIAVYFKWLSYLAIYFLVPLLFILPWTLLVNSYQHYSEGKPMAGRAYSILFKNRFLQELLFPLNLNFHEVHHQRPDLPYYQLPMHYVDSQNSFSFLSFSKRIFNSQKSKIL